MKVLLHECLFTVVIDYVFKKLLVVHFCSSHMGIELLELLEGEVSLHMLSRARCPYSSVGYAGGVKNTRMFCMFAT